MTSDNNTLELPELWQSGQIDCQAVLDMVKVIQFEAPTMPVDSVIEAHHQGPDRYTTDLNWIRVDDGVAHLNAAFHDEMFNKL